MVVVEGGEKMSKSLGNVVSLPELLADYDPRAYRLLVLQSHYRSPLTVTDTTLRAAGQGVERLDALARRFPTGPGARGGGVLDEAALERFRAHMDDDLGTVQATAEMFDAVKAANTLADEGRLEEAGGLAAAVFEMCRAVGLDLDDGTVAEPDSPAHGLAAERDAARKRGDYAAADALRRQLRDEGWIVEDTPGGTVIRRGNG